MTRKELEQMADEYVNAPGVGLADVVSLTELLADAVNEALEEAADLYDENAGANDQQMIRALKVKP